MKTYTDSEAALGARFALGHRILCAVAVRTNGAVRRRQLQSFVRGAAFLALRRISKVVATLRALRRRLLLREVAPILERLIRRRRLALRGDQIAPLDDGGEDGKDDERTDAAVADEGRSRTHCGTDAVCV
mgnify:CR=1 FL=1